MTEYGNGNGNSGITAYQTGANYIDIQFRGGKVYRYSENTVGELYLLTMKVLASGGKGLNSFINKYVRRRKS